MSSEAAMARPEPPVLDPRTPTEMADALAAWARLDVPEWRPPSDGDVGTVLQEVFAQMAARVAARVNAVPGHAFRAFLEMAEIDRLAPAPARGPVAFALAPSADSTRVVAGTQVVAAGQDGGPDVVYETVDDLIVLPVRLVAAVVTDPVWDQMSDLLPELDAHPEGLPALVGIDDVAHEVQLTSSPMRAFSGGGNATVTLKCVAPDLVVGDAVALLEHLAVRVESETGDVSKTPSWTVTTKPQSPGAPPGAPDTPSPLISLATAILPIAPPLVEVTATCTIDASDHERIVLVLLGGVNRPAGRLLRWSHASLRLDTPDHLPVSVLVDGSSAAVDRAFAPFGDVPGPGSEFALADEAFGVTGAEVTLKFDVSGGSPSKDLELVWEYYGGQAWQALTVTDGTTRFTASGNIIIKAPGCPVAEVSGTAGRWIRVRVAAGDYGQPAVYVPKVDSDVNQGLKLKDGTGTLKPPVVLTLGVTSSISDAAPKVTIRTGSHDSHAPAQLFAGLADLGPVHGEPGQGLYFGLDRDPSNQPVSLYLDVVDAAATPRRDIAAGGGDVRLVWECFDGAAWRPLTVEDTTGGLTRAGIVRFVAPAAMAPLARFGRPACWWLRVRALNTVWPGASPVVAGVAINVVEVVAGESVPWERLGHAIGQPSQSVRLAQTPVLPGQQLFVAEGDRIGDAELARVVEEDGPNSVVQRIDPLTGRMEDWVRWHEVPSFTTSDPSSRHYTLDRSTGELRFGDGRHGLLPPQGSPLAAIYRYRGSLAGNVSSGRITKLRSPQPEIAVVINPGAVDGGADIEPVADVEERGPAVLRHRGRAVTTADFVWLAREVAGTRVARCALGPCAKPGEVKLVVVPRDSDVAPRPTSTLLSRVEAGLQPHLPLDLALSRRRLDVRGPAYRTVSVFAELEPERSELGEQIKSGASAALDRFLAALSGGPDGTGWPLGRAVFESEVAEVLAGVEGVSHVRSLRVVGVATEQRLRFRSAIVLPFGLRTGGAVEQQPGRFVMTLDSPIPAGVAVNTIDVRGATDGDRLCVVSDAEVAPGASGSHVLLLAADGIPNGTDPFPAGSEVRGQDGELVAWTAGPVAPADASGRRPVPLSVVPGLVLAPDLLVVSPYDVRVLRTGGSASEHTTRLYARGIRASALAKGMTLGIPGHPLRLRLLGEPVGGSSAGTFELPVSSWRPGDQLTLRTGSGAPITAEVAGVEDVDDVVHLDPDSLVAPGTHVVQVVTARSPR
jgi:hypothetical protein